MLLLLIEVFFTIIIGYLIVLYYKQLQRNKLFPVPSPTLIPVLGHVLSFGSTAEDICKSIIRLVATYGKLLQIWVGPFQHYYLVSDSEITNKILSSTKLIEKSVAYDLIKPWLGNGLLVSRGEKWRQRRKILTPAFHFTILEQSVNTFTSASDIFIKKLKKHANGDSFDVYPYISLLGLDIICKTALSIDINAQIQSDSEYVTAVRNTCRIVFERMFSAVQQSDFVFYNLTTNGKVFKKSLKILHSMTNQVIEARRQLLLETIDNSRTETEINIEKSKQKMVFIDVLLMSTIDGKPLTNYDIQEEVDTFMFEGHDTVSSGVSFTLYLLANHPEIQNRVFEEIKDICGNDLNKHATMSDLNKMVYLDAVIKESMRLYPPVPIVGRILSEDLPLDSGVMPKDSHVSILIYCMHHDPEYFEDPEAFKPERFLTDNQNRNYFSYVPFSAGSRNCIGQKFAMYEMKSTISSVIRHYELYSAGPEFDVKLAMSIVIKSTNGIHIKLKSRFSK